MIFVQFAANLSPLPNTDPLEQAAVQTLQYASPQFPAAPEADLSIVLTDDNQLHQLNLQFLGIDAPTDVLSFQDGTVDPDTGSLYLGDVLISVPRAQAQATLGGHPLPDELQLLVVHGVLHLLGHDHAETDEKQRMWQAQTAVLQTLGCAITSPTTESIA